MSEKRNENLIQELYKEMEEELDRDPVEMDTEKIKHINLLLAKLEGRETLPPDMELEPFLERFDRKYGLDLSSVLRKSEKPVVSQKIKRVSWRSKAVAATIIIAVLAGVGNAVSVAAMDKSLWQFIKETSHGVYYRTLDTGRSAVEKRVNEQYETYSDWESLKESVELSILIPEYIPEGLRLEIIDKNIFENGVEIAAYYQDGDIQLNISCEYYAIKGDFFKNKGGKEVLGQQKRIGARNVDISMEEGINIIFEENGIIYIVDTNLELEEAEKIIENLK